MRWAVTEAYLDTDGPHCETVFVYAPDWFGALRVTHELQASGNAREFEEGGTWFHLKDLSLEKACAQYYEDSTFFLNIVTVPMEEG